MKSVAIIGGTGYTGKYLIEFCNNHPNISDINIYANTSAGKNLYDVFPEFKKSVPNLFIHDVNKLSYNHDIYFTALPHGKAMDIVPILINNNKKVIDLGADYRLDDKLLFEKTYEIPHGSPTLLNQKHYGLYEQSKSYNYNLIANPGCYPTAVLLSALPFVKFFTKDIISIDTVAYSGISGAGKKVSANLMFSENYNSVKAYNVGKHRHEVEIKQELDKRGNQLNYSITTHLLPIYSGIYSTTIINLNKELSQQIVNDILVSEYKNEKFIRIRKTPPELKWVHGTNFCDINAVALNNKIIITSAIDNLIKGASGQAIQNMNKLFGWENSFGIQIFSEEFNYA